MVTLLTSPWYGELNPTWMPGPNTSNFSQPFVSLSRKLLSVPSAGYTFKSVSFSYSYEIDHFILGKYSSNWNFFFEMISSKVNFVSHRATIQLNFHDMGFLLPVFIESSFGFFANMFSPDSL